MLQEANLFDYGAYYEKELNELLKREPAGEDEKLLKEHRVKELKHKIKFARIHLGVHSRPFKYVGDNKQCPVGSTSSALLRSFDSDLVTDTFINIPGEQYADMLELLSAHIFFHEPADEELEEAKRTQNKGIREYMLYYEEHLHSLELKYGYEKPSFATVLVNYADIFNEAACLQEGANLIVYDNRVLDDNDPKDVRLRHMTKYYQVLMWEMVAAAQRPFVNPEDEDIEHGYEKNVLRDYGDSLEYLKTHPYVPR